MILLNNKKIVFSFIVIILIILWVILYYYFFLWKDDDLSDQEIDLILSGETIDSSIQETDDSMIITGQTEPEPVVINNSQDITWQNISWTDTQIQPPSDQTTQQWQSVQSIISSTNMLSWDNIYRLNNEQSLTDSWLQIWYYNYLWRMDMGMWQYENAIIQFSKALSFDKRWKEELYAWTLRNRSLAYEKLASQNSYDENKSNEYYNNALIDLSQAIKMSPRKSVETLYNYRQWIYQKWELFEKIWRYYDAINTYKQLENIYKDKIDTKKEQLRSYFITTANSYVNSNKPNDAIKYMDYAMKLNWKKWMIEKLKLLMRLADNTSNDADKLNFLNKALWLDANYKEAISKKADILARRTSWWWTDHDDYKQILLKVWEWFEWIWMFDDALIYYNEILRIDPKSESAINAKVAILTNKVWTNNSITKIDVKLESNPNDLDLLMQKADAFIELWKYDSAIYHYDVIMSHNPNDNIALQKKSQAMKQKSQKLDALKSALYDLADYFRLLWNNKNALKYYYKVKNIDPSDSSVDSKISELES